MAEREPTIEDVTALTCAATPQFAYQIRARVRELVEGMPADHPTRRYGEEQMRLLDHLGRSSSIAAAGPIEPSTRIGWEQIKSHRPVDEVR